MAKFPMELLGSEIVVEGTITQVAAAGMAGEATHEGEGIIQEKEWQKLPEPIHVKLQKLLHHNPFFQIL